ncbi:MAG: hypothetical protein ACYTFG_08180 [Planctomycetota bacterium]|jgi:hypothetical protein
MMGKRKSAMEKLRTPSDREVKRSPKGLLLIPTPLDVVGQMCRVRKGKVTTIMAIRERLAREHGAEITCPLCTGIFSRIAAEAAEEERARGKKRITPYWRTLKAGGALNEKFPGGVKKQAALLREEGHTILPARGKQPPKLAEFEKVLSKG